MRAITVELDRRASAFTGELATIYFGGGTPSLWRPDCLASAIVQIRERFAGTPREVTIEANPTDCTPENLDAWRAAGIDRVSIGVQSLDAKELVVLGRDHRFGDGRAAVERAKAAGFTVSMDLIAGIPGGDNALDHLATDHLSVYELTIEPRTAFGKRGMAPLPEDTLADLYIATHERLVAAGYDHYEISSYAKPGKRAVHNSLYWRGSAFLGLGVGAASLELRADGSGIRATNPRRAAAYIAAPGEPAEVLTCTPADLAAERVWLGMRTSDGVAAADLAGTDLAGWLVGEGLATRVGDRICPTLRGFLFADRIAGRVVETWDAKLATSG